MKLVSLSVLAGITLTLNACVARDLGNAPLIVEPENAAIYPVASVLEKVKTNYDYRMVLKEDKGMEISSIITPAGSVQRNGQDLLKSIEHSTFEVNDSKRMASNVKMEVVRAFTTDYFYTLDPFVYYGFKAGTGEFSEVVMHKPIPENATVGDFSLYAIEDRYFKEKKYPQHLSYRYTWSLSKADANTAWLCDNVESFVKPKHHLNLQSNPEPDFATNYVPDYETEGGDDDSYNTCYRIDKRGQILDAKITVPPTKNREGYTYLLKQ